MIPGKMHGIAMRLVIVALSLCCRLLPAAPPHVTKVDPPSWWAGHSINPVRLLVRGTDFAGARISTTSREFLAENVRVNDHGSYVFVDLRIPPSAPPGPVHLTLSTASGQAAIPFEILPALPREGRFGGFSQDDLIYLIMPDRFANGDRTNDDPAIARGLLDRSQARYYHGGDLQGVIDRLTYLKELGITAIWMNPVYDNVNHLNRKETYDRKPITDYHGYGAVDFYAVDEHLGTLAKFRELVDAAHAQGIRVIQDQVANHTGPYHPWVEDSPTPTWYNGTLAHHLANTWQTWTLMDPHSPAAMRKPTLDGWFLDILPDLNQDEPEVARYLIQNTLWWIGVSGIDGIRQDTLPYVPRTFWRAWMSAIKREYPEFRVVGEMFDSDPALVSFFQGGTTRFDGIDSGVDSLFDFPVFFTLRRAFANGRSLKEVANMVGHDYLYPQPDRLVTFLGLHDVQRFMSEQGASPAGLKLAFTFLLTARGIPMIYYGDEIGMPGGNDPDNRRDFPGGFPDDRRNAFTPEGRSRDEQAVYVHVRELARLRRSQSCLRHGEMSDLLATDQVWVYQRSSPGCAALIALNNDTKSAQVKVRAAGFADGLLRDALGAANASVQGGELTVELPPRSSAVFVSSVP